MVSQVDLFSPVDNMPPFVDSESFELQMIFQPCHDETTATDATGTADGGTEGGTSTQLVSRPAGNDPNATQEKRNSDDYLGLYGIDALLQGMILTSSWHYTIPLTEGLDEMREQEWYVDAVAFALQRTQNKTDMAAYLLLNSFYLKLCVHAEPNSQLMRALLRDKENERVQQLEDAKREEEEKAAAKQRDMELAERKRRQTADARIGAGAGSGTGTGGHGGGGQPGVQVEGRQRDGSTPPAISGAIAPARQHSQSAVRTPRDRWFFDLRSDGAGKDKGSASAVGPNQSEAAGASQTADGQSGLQVAVNTTSGQGMGVDNSGMMGAASPSSVQLNVVLQQLVQNVHQWHGYREPKPTGSDNQGKSDPPGNKGAAAAAGERNPNTPPSDAAGYTGLQGAEALLQDLIRALPQLGPDGLKGTTA